MEERKFSIDDLRALADKLRDASVKDVEYYFFDGRRTYAMTAQGGIHVIKGDPGLPYDWMTQ